MAVNTLDEFLDRCNPPLTVRETGIAICAWEAAINTMVKKSTASNSQSNQLSADMDFIILV